eukprot:CAMPEP_0206137528 /NCGR_PEP_ID=MMETSP1473-20131121/2635_1 /ASSEMBLY_ACC=CAM_ASM_001109 /TAXON_ID=1461547 /ORGANISM="Stichococcus sp, Strain RCC1054" /LENGTH=537 /DNA_ID=CAMNT_0053530661 /DNA_START=465 /DNA_END=2078 /DNA_ORIENTATION=-
MRQGASFIVLAMVGLLSAATFAAAATMQRAGFVGDRRHLLVFKEDIFHNVAEPEVAELCKKAGGRLLVWHAAIGTALAESVDNNFSATVMALDERLHSAEATDKQPVGRHSRLPEQDNKQQSAPVEDADAANGRSAAGVDYNWGDTLSNRQWDMEQINVPGAQKLTRGKSNVIVGVIDTGIDRTHPDIKPTLRTDLSVGCVGGVARKSVSAWKDDNGHGTHTASTVAAASNKRGLVGVAPGARIAAIKAGDKDGFFYAEAIVCAFMHAADNGFAVTSNSYYADPWYFNCKSDPDQNAIYTAISRAVKYALGKKVSVIVAAGNSLINLDDPKIDNSSPNNGTEEDVIFNRPVNNNCPLLPAGLPGVVTVSAVGNTTQISTYSNYGFTYVALTAPGGDGAYPTKYAARGTVLGAWPTSLRNSADGPLLMQSGAAYVYLEGTSMAAPHVAGVAALIISTYKSSQRPTPAQVKKILQDTARPMKCPSSARFCRTSASKRTNYFGHGQVDALRAVRAGGSEVAKKSKPTRKPTKKPTRRASG